MNGLESAQQKRLQIPKFSQDSGFNKILQQLVDAHDVQYSRVEKLLEENRVLRAYLQQLVLSPQISKVVPLGGNNDLRVASQPSAQASPVIVPDIAGFIPSEIACPVYEPPSLPGCPSQDEMEEIGRSVDGTPSATTHFASSEDGAYELTGSCSLTLGSKCLTPNCLSPRKTSSCSRHRSTKMADVREGSENAWPTVNQALSIERIKSEGFTMWKNWQMQSKRLQWQLSRISRQSSNRFDEKGASQFRHSLRSFLSGPSSFKQFVIMPNSPYRMAWDIIGMVLLIYDMLTVPMLAFKPEEGLVWTITACFALVFWSFDMVLSLITGYVSKGITITEPRLVVKHYFRTWFIPDLVLLVPDWIFTYLNLFAGRDSGEGSISKLLRTMRAVRVVRLLRLAKMRHAMAVIRDLIDSEYMFIILTLVKYLVMLLLVNHFIGAGWYFVGDFSKSQGMDSWIDRVEGLAGGSLALRYLTSLHWSLSQFTPGTISVEPQNPQERAYAVTCLILGLLVFSSFISSITASMTQLQAMQGEKTRQLWLVRMFLRQHQVEKSLAFRIQRYLEYAVLHSDNTIQEDKIYIMRLLSDQLSDELHFKVSYTTLQVHPLFENAMKISKITLFRLCRRALSTESLAPNDVLFKNGQDCVHMYFVPVGCVRYIKGEEQGFTRVEEDDWLCEHALWAKWLHFGEARAAKASTIVSLQVEAFAKEMSEDVTMHVYMCAYARKYLQWLNDVSFDDLTDVSLGWESAKRVSGFLVKQDSSASSFLSAGD